MHTATAFLKASDTVLQNILTWTAQQFMSGLPLISIKNSMNLGVQSSQETGKGKKVFLSFATQHFIKEDMIELASG